LRVEKLQVIIWMNRGYWRLVSVALSFKRETVLTKLVSILFILISTSGTVMGQDWASGPGALARLTGNYSDMGVDDDDDGMYDLLAIEVGVEVAMPGEYSIVGFLCSQDGEEVGWSVDHQMLSPGRNSMLLQFDGKTIGASGINGSYRLRDLTLSYGSSDTGLSTFDRIDEAYNTSSYSFIEFSPRASGQKVISGSGEVLLTININKALPVSYGRYSLDVVGINIPPISSGFSINSSRYGYAYRMDSIYMPNKPNNFTVAATSVKDINVGLKKLQPASYSKRWENNTWDSDTKTRMWVSTQNVADDRGIAMAESDLLSPGNYHLKIFGKAAENSSEVYITMTMIKKIIVDGRFNLCINTTGFPDGDYSINARALNGTLNLDELAINGFSIAG
jgi:hypothetical protein